MTEEKLRLIKHCASEKKYFLDKISNKLGNVSENKRKKVNIGDNQAQKNEADKTFRKKIIHG